MWTRSAKRQGEKVKVECWDFDGNVFYTGEFDTVAEADQAGQDAERRMTMAMMAKDAPTLDDIFSEMSVDEIAAELLA